jgi:hypothetical protein
VAVLSVARRYGVASLDPFEANTVHGRPLDGEHTETGVRFGFVVFSLAMLASLFVSVVVVSVALGLG